jgi:Leucine rich repeat N-terminal domain
VHVSFLIHSTFGVNREFASDLFNNKLSGTIPEALTKIQSLQILHIKLNRLTGTISEAFGSLPFLSWFDVSTNRLHGTIPDSFGTSRTLKDFRLGGNMVYDPIPKSLCTNPNINGGLTRTYGCGGVICPLGTYSDPGHATHSEGCKPCPEGRTTMYLGGSKCIRITEADIITILYDIMQASSSSPLQRSHWETDRAGNICSWKGITCDEANEIIESISFPLLGLNEH